MAMHTTDFSPAHPGLFDRFFARFGKAMTHYIEARSRHTEIAALEAKSDAELAQMGITRDRIVNHVFRDVIGYC